VKVGAPTGVLVDRILVDAIVLLFTVAVVASALRPSSELARMAPLVTVNVGALLVPAGVTEPVT
jgi:hypothetical protein